MAGAMLEVQLFFFGKQRLNGFAVHFIRYAAIYRADGRTLRFFVETLALRAFVGNDIIYINGNRFVAFAGWRHLAVHQGIIAGYGSAVRYCPFDAAFIYCIVRTLWFAGSAVDAFVCNLDSHKIFPKVRFGLATKLQFRAKIITMIQATTEERIALLNKLGTYMSSDLPEWQAARETAVQRNGWFTPQAVALATNAIVTHFLQKDKLEKWLDAYVLPENSKKVGIVMAGNIPLVGFHDFVCCFLSGHQLLLKLSEKDNVLLPHLLAVLQGWDERVGGQVQVADRLNYCDAYIATGSNNTARYFEQYFGKYPHIIRRNRTSVALLDGSESTEELMALGDDVFNYYGLGCRNVTQLCVPPHYDFATLLKTWEAFNYLENEHKYKNNYDYHLAIYLLNRVPYMSNAIVLLTENTLPFSAVSVLHYRYYQDKNSLIQELSDSSDIQCIVGHGFVPFGCAQQPSLSDYADGVDTMAFLCRL